MGWGREEKYVYGAGGEICVWGRGAERGNVYGGREGKYVYGGREEKCILRGGGGEGGKWSCDLLQVGMV